MVTRWSTSGVPRTEVETGNVRELFQSSQQQIYVNAVFEDVVWLSNETLLVCTVVSSDDELPPERPAIPSGPKIRSSEKKRGIPPRSTDQNLLEDEHDEKLLNYYGKSQLVVASLDGSKSDLGEPGIHTGMIPSPDGKYILIESIHKVDGRFFKKVEVWKIDDGTVCSFRENEVLEKTLRNLPLSSKDIPIEPDGTRKGKRSIQWRTDKPSTLCWVESKEMNGGRSQHEEQDGGDAKVQSTQHDVMYTLELLEPTENKEPKRLHELELRFRSIKWCDDSLALVHESCEKTGTTRMWFISPGGGSDDEGISRSPPIKVFDSSLEKADSDPGRIPLMRRTPQGRYKIAKVKIPEEEDPGDENIYILLKGRRRDTPEGDIPCLNSVEIKTGKKKASPIWESDTETYYETVVWLMSDQYEGECLPVDQMRLLISRESSTTTTQYFIQGHKDKKLHQITEFSEPRPQLKLSTKTITYKVGKDEYAADLYLPQRDEAPLNLPCLVWVYPEDKPKVRTATEAEPRSGPIRSNSPKRFNKIVPTSPLAWLSMGFAVLYRPPIHIIGDDHNHPNDTYLKQLREIAHAIVKALKGTNLVDPNKIAVGGHSYGASAVANLLANEPDLFCCGIARSGAYNRTLTPFGFQKEKRKFWEASNVYYEMSPFISADKIQKPILLIHGEEDKNTGTWTMQSARFFDALRGLGKFSRLVILPLEGHQYVARESILHVQWETGRWLNNFCPTDTFHGSSLASTSAQGEELGDQYYRVPAPEITNIVDNFDNCKKLLSPCGNLKLILKYQPQKRQDMVKKREREVYLAGIQIDRLSNCQSNTLFFSSIWIQSTKDANSKSTVYIPEDSEISFVTWSDDSKHLAFAVRNNKEEDSINRHKLRVWVAEAKTGKARDLFRNYPDIYLNAFFDDYDDFLTKQNEKWKKYKAQQEELCQEEKDKGNERVKGKKNNNKGKKDKEPQEEKRGLRGMMWVNKNTLLVCTIPTSRPKDPPPDSDVLSGPNQYSAQEKVDPVITGQDFIKDQHHAELFDHYATSRLVLVSLDDKNPITLMQPLDAFTLTKPSRRDGNNILIESVQRPKLIDRPYNKFHKRYWVYTDTGRLVSEKPGKVAQDRCTGS
ncbi:OLC1v1004433C1 [Oldenlandia corymbosa var. corymbosa]|uniref:OLC1v1004433C1 n=1 Tax=Oldenlandia corymbosa var. corymbosa TaxID=529605 RepID=A0AAV1DC93_OLDCO|nr:OLC1v1004433C1 [Oldenlandia corymbosa var. corymbosa]